MSEQVGNDRIVAYSDVIEAKVTSTAVGSAFAFLTFTKA